MRKCMFLPMSRTRCALSIARRCCHNETVSRSVEHLVDRIVIRATGQDVLDYLQGLVTADIMKLNSTAILYTAFLNSKGRILFDAFVHKNVVDDDILIECHRDVSDKLMNHLKLYKVRRKTAFSVDDNLKVLVGNLKDLGGVDDPRTPLLGQRMVSSKDISLLNSSYHNKRYRLGIAEGPSEIPPGNCFPLEYNLEWLNGVSFDKGCYIGQELTARTHHTGVVRKRIMPLTLCQLSDKISYGNSIVDVETGKTVGSVRGLMENTLLALMRVKETLASKHLCVENTDANVIIPDWWPKEFK